MSDMIKCDSCGKIMYADSRSEKGAYHELMIDRQSWFHVCKCCYDNLLNKFFPDVLRSMIKDDGYILDPLSEGE